MNCTKCKNKPATMFDALESIIWYDGHYEWLKELRDTLETLSADETYCCPIETEFWHTEKHTIWMLLVGMFGDWGTSIRSGWIDKIPECIEFIDAVCETSWSEE